MTLLRFDVKVEVTMIYDMNAYTRGLYTWHDTQSFTYVSQGYQRICRYVCWNFVDGKELDQYGKWILHMQLSDNALMQLFQNG